MTNFCDLFPAIYAQEAQPLGSTTHYASFSNDKE